MISIFGLVPMYKCGGQVILAMAIEPSRMEADGKKYTIEDFDMPEELPSPQRNPSAGNTYEHKVREFLQPLRMLEFNSSDGWVYSSNSTGMKFPFVLVPDCCYVVDVEVVAVVVVVVNQTTFIFRTLKT